MSFEPNKRYEIEMLNEDGTRSFLRGISSAVDGNLLTLSIEGRERIFNTNSSVFIGAREWMDLSQSVYKSMAAPTGKKNWSGD